MELRAREFGACAPLPGARASSTATGAQVEGEAGAAGMEEDGQLQVRDRRRSGHRMPRRLLRSHSM
eukprot:3798646-Pyramimonas_sp.AAC.1